MCLWIRMNVMQLVRAFQPVVLLMAVLSGAAQSAKTSAELTKEMNRASETGDYAAAARLKEEIKIAETRENFAKHLEEDKQILIFQRNYLAILKMESKPESQEDQEIIEEETVVIGDLPAVVIVGTELTVNSVLTPNADGVNDFLVFSGLDNLSPKNNLTVKNSGSTAIYTDINYGNDWNGTSVYYKILTRFPPGTYTYELELKGPLLGTYKGTFELVR